MSFWFSVLGGLVLEAVLLGLAGFTAYRVGCALAPEPSDVLERIVFAGLAGITGWVALLQVLGLIGILWLPVVAACLAVLAGISLLALPSPAPCQVVASRVPWGLVAVAAPFAVLAVVEVLWGPPLSNSYDTLHYHVVNAAHYLDSGTIRSLPFAQPGDNTGAAPGNGSLLLLAVMLPFHNAGLVALPDLLCAGLLVAVTALLSRELGRGAWPGLVTGLVIVTAVCFFETQVRSGYDDTVGLLGLLAAVLLGLRSARSGDRLTLLLAGLSLGLAVGTKGSYILPGVAVAAVVLWAHRTHPGRVGSLGFLAATLSLCAAWYVRDWIITGDPLFPQTVRIGSRVLFAGLSGSAADYSRYDQSLAGALLAAGGSGVARWVGPAVLNFGVSLAAPVSCLAVVWFRGRSRLVAIAALACTAAYTVTPFTGSSLPAQLTGGLRFLLPAVALGVVAVGAVLPDRWFRLSALVTLAVDTVVLIDVEWSNNFVNLPLLVVAGAVTVCVLAAIRWRVALGAAAGWPSVRVAAAVAVATLAVLATAHLQPSTSPSPVQRALDAARNPSAPVVVMDVGDVATILGPQLDTDIVAVGNGPVGAERPIRNPAQLTLRIEFLHAAAVVVGTEAEFNVVPVTWSPPTTWRMLGTEGGAVVYEP